MSAAAANDSIPFIPPRKSANTAPLVEPLLRKADVARTLGVCQRSVDGYIAAGKLKIVKLGVAVRIDPADLRAFVEAAKQ
jgi:Helix-turn-helix domain